MVAIISLLRPVNLFKILMGVGAFFMVLKFLLIGIYAPLAVFFFGNGIRVFLIGLFGHGLFVWPLNIQDKLMK